MSKTINTKIFRDSDLITTFTFGGKETVYTVEFKDDKARVVNPFGNAFGGSKRSHFNKLKMVYGCLCLESYKVYSLVVEGKKVFLQIFTDENLNK